MSPLHEGLAYKKTKTNRCNAFDLQLDVKELLGALRGTIHIGTANVANLDCCGLNNVLGETKQEKESKPPTSTFVHKTSF